ncbi:unnamed protein product [Oikopleura dioica]|uniref:Uncharacterized protein n=1 Tax=Oikopleura dioica TaxID=34765 RepID=E4WWE8_OIKDI|nr:unnamed protein product [Oikopleura dioica]
MKIYLFLVLFAFGEKFDKETKLKMKEEKKRLKKEQKLKEKAEKKAKKRKIHTQELADFEVNLKSSQTILEDEQEVVGLNYTEFARQYSKAVSDLGVPETMTNYQINEGFEKNILWSLKNKFELENQAKSFLLGKRIPKLPSHLALGKIDRFPTDPTMSCFQCDEKDTDACWRKGKEQICHGANHVCQIEVRKRFGRTERISMGCKQLKACKDNKSQNFNQKPETPTKDLGLIIDYQCNPIDYGSESTCRQCCTTKNCNRYYNWDSFLTMYDWDTTLP